MVIYELPMRWVDAGEDGQSRQVGLGTFEKALFERLWDAASSIRALGVNCIELLPVQDSPDTLNWGYGTRFFFAPDYDMGSRSISSYLSSTATNIESASSSI
jgi:1,4-alpha-glucan branching enzyme